MHGLIAYHLAHSCNAHAATEALFRHVCETQTGLTPPSAAHGAACIICHSWKLSCVLTLA